MPDFTEAQLQQLLATTLNSTNNTLSAALAGLRAGPRESVLPTLSTTEALAFETWKSRANETIAINDWKADDTKKKRAVRMLKAALDGSMGVAAGHLSTEDYDDPDAFLKALEEIVVTPAGAMMAEAQFEGCRQRSDEETLAYSTRLRNCYRRAYPDGDFTQAMELKKRFFRGLADQSVARSVSASMLANLKTTAFNDLVAMVLNQQAANILCAEPKTNQNMVGALGGTKPNQGKGGKNGQGGKGTSWNGGGSGKFTGKCFKCHKVGHRRAECPENKKGTVNAMGNGEEEEGERKPDGESGN